MLESIKLEPVDALTVQILMDNVTDPTLLDAGAVKRANFFNMASGPRVPAAVLTGVEAPAQLVAEHGFSALITVTKADREHRILFDAGVSPYGVVENMHRLEIPLGDVELIVLSHGHWDHVTGMEGIAKELGRANVPVLIHPEFWSRRRIAFPGIDPLELPSPSRSALEGVGFEIVEERHPSFLLDGSVLITGEVDRTTKFEIGFPGHEAHRDGAWHADPLILDDQAIVLNLRDRGLVEISGCGHAGIVNTVRYALKLTGERRVCAIIGGFHLSGPMFEPIIDSTIDGLVALSPSLLVPAHCTGWKAMQRLAARFPEAFVQSAVGSRIQLGTDPDQP